MKSLTQQTPLRNNNQVLNNRAYYYNDLSINAKLNYKGLLVKSANDPNITGNIVIKHNFVIMCLPLI